MRIATLLLVVTAACSPYSPDLGNTPFLCGSAAPQCPDGYTCSGGDAGVGAANPGVCVKNGATAPDGPNPNGMCADDSQIETQDGANNDTVATAYQTPVATSRGSIDFAGLAICPSGDKDYYAVFLTKTQSIDVTITYEAWGGVPQASIQSCAGTIVGQFSPVSGMDRTLHSSVANLSSGTWYVEVQGPASTGSNETRNNYTLSINVTPFP